MGDWFIGGNQKMISKTEYGMCKEKFIHPDEYDHEWSDEGEHLGCGRIWSDEGGYSNDQILQAYKRSQCYHAYTCAAQICVSV